jgi:hypothetical protein
MGAMTNLLVKDDSNPLVEFTLVPITNLRPKWRGQVAGVPVNAQITAEQLANETLKSGDYRRVFKTELPVLETLGTAGTSAGYTAPQKVAYKIPVTTSVLAPARATAADIANALKIHLAMLAGATSATATGTLNGASAADAVKSSTAPIPRFFVYGEDAF